VFMRFLNKRKGVTLIELLAAVVIIGIVSALAVPNFQEAIRWMNFRNGTRDIVAKLRLARSNAITTKRQYGVYFDCDAKIMKMFLDTISVADYRYDNGDSIIEVDTLPKEFSTLTTPGSFTNYSVIYKPNGSASASGQIVASAYNAGCHFDGYISVLASTGKTKIDSLIKH